MSKFQDAQENTRGATSSIERQDPQAASSSEEGNRLWAARTTASKDVQRQFVATWESGRIKVLMYHGT